MKRFILVLAMAVFTIMVISSCGGVTVQSAAPGKDIKYKTVKIKTKNLDPSDSRRPHVSPRCAELRHGRNEQIKWEIDDSKLRFTVMFNKETGRPFDGDVFDNVRNTSGPIVIEPDENDRFYSYSLKVDGFELIDPGVIIWR